MILTVVLQFKPIVVKKLWLNHLNLSLHKPIKVIKFSSSSLNHLVTEHNHKKSSVSMLVNSHNSVVFQNFRNQSCYLNKSQPVVSQFFQVESARTDSESTSASLFSIMSPIALRIQQYFKKSQTAKLREKTTQAALKDISHGEYPISMLDNTAIKEFLEELDVTHAVLQSARKIRKSSRGGKIKLRFFIC